MRGGSWKYILGSMKCLQKCEGRKQLPPFWVSDSSQFPWLALSVGRRVEVGEETVEAGQTLVNLCAMMQSWT